MSTKILLIICSVLLFSCKKAEDRACAKSIGHVITEERDLSPFHSLRLFDGIHYKLIQDSLDKVVVTCGENLMNFVNTELENESLTITDDNKCLWLRELPVDIKVEIHYTSLDYVYNESHGLTEMVSRHEAQELIWENWHVSGKSNLDIDVNTCYLRISAGASEIIVDGEVNNLYIYQSVEGRVNAQGLSPSYCWADNKGTADMKVRVADGGVLQYIIDSYGDIRFSGNPSEIILVEQNGTGSLVAE